MENDKDKDGDAHTLTRAEIDCGVGRLLSQMSSGFIRNANFLLVLS